MANEVGYGGQTIAGASKMYSGSAAGKFQTGNFFQNAYQTLFGGSAGPQGSGNGSMPGLTWCKVIFMMCFPFFDAAMGTPYSGQIFPTGTSVGSSGQVFPTRG